MFQRRSQPAYSGVDPTSEQHILTVLRFHEVRLGKIEKHLVTINKQLELLTMQRKQEPKKPEPAKVSTQTKSTNNITDYSSFTLLKNMMINLTEQAEVSQSFMKELKEVVSNLKLNQENFFSRQLGQIDTADVPAEKEESSVELNSSSDDHDTNSKLLELERNIAKASIISIGMEPTVNRVDKYIERSRSERRKILNNLETNKEEETNEISFSTYIAQKEEETNEEETNEETNEEETNEEEINDMLHPIVDDTVLENDIIKLANLKSHIEEEVQEVIGKIPVIIKPKKKRRGRPKKT